MPGASLLASELLYNSLTLITSHLIFPQYQYTLLASSRVLVNGAQLAGYYPNSHQKSSLEQLEGKEKAKTINPEDRRAINEALTDQTNITMMFTQGRSSQLARKQNTSEGRKPVQ